MSQHVKYYNSFNNDNPEWLRKMIAIYKTIKLISKLNIFQEWKWNDSWWCRRWLLWRSSQSLELLFWWWRFRLLSILEKLSDQSANLVNPNHCPKGQLGQIWANLDQNWDRGRSRKNCSILEGKWGPVRWKIERFDENSKLKGFKGTTPNFG